MRELLDKRALTASDKQLIEDAYLNAFAREMAKRKNCRNCYNDAIIEILAASRKGQPRLKYGQLLKHEGKVYNRHSDIPKEIIELYKDLFTNE